jgi:beta-carotene/zeaxanthin 4-ketolase
MAATDSSGKWTGFLIAGLVYIFWIGHLAFWLSSDLSQAALAWIIMAVLVQTWFYTGLFITAHDAMHGGIVPGHERLNLWVGRVAVVSYALFSFKKLLQRHGLHHSFPASERDPDFHDGAHTHPLRWYLHFMLNYLTVMQLAGMALLFNLLHYGAGVPVGNLLLFWVAPALLSTWQLFYFGTYLPHRRPAEGYDNMHRSSTSDYPVWLSLLTCFHFGYHLEHHVQPTVPWWRLPDYH